MHHNRRIFTFRDMNATQIDVLSLENPVFCVYLTSTCLLGVKMLLIVLLTIYKRSVHKTFLSPEDANFNHGQIELNESVERVRRAHLNDLENIPLFWTIGLVFLWTKPSLTVAFLLYYGFTIVRFFHTIVYAVLVVPQPTRTILFLIGFGITWYMSVRCMIVGFKALLS